MKHKLLIATILLAGLAAGMLASLVHRQPALRAATVFDTPRGLPAPELTDQDGVRLTPDRFEDRWDVLFFGFTRCPDICPMTLTRLRGLADKLPPGQAPRVWLVTVDPEHDTAPVLSKYVSFYDPDFAAITGSGQAIGELAGALGVAYAKIPDGDSYTMSHSAALFLIDPDGHYAGLFNTPHDWGNIMHDLEQLTR